MACSCGGTCGCGDVTVAAAQVLEFDVENQLPAQRAELSARLALVEAAIIALAASTLPFGDSEGHPFRGNQWRDALDDMLADRESKAKADRAANPWNPKNGDPLPANFAKGDKVKLTAKVNARSLDPLTGTQNTADSFKLIKRGTEAEVLEVGDRFSVFQFKGTQTPQSLRNDMVKPL